GGAESGMTVRQGRSWRPSWPRSLAASGGARARSRMSLSGSCGGLPRWSRGRPRHGDLPDQWSDSLNHELALALAVSVQSAEKTALIAWELGARLPGIAALHADGTLAYAKARLIAETFEQLSDEDAAKAESMILPQLTGTTGKTFG